MPHVGPLHALKLLMHLTQDTFHRQLRPFRLAQQVVLRFVALAQPSLQSPDVLLVFLRYLQLFSTNSCAVSSRLFPYIKLLTSQNDFLNMVHSPLGRVLTALNSIAMV